eukprot:Amastigsp_a709_40.p3 type:complete len:188 gc:universal Amastigsp_a709_40:575-1138(+)
MSPERRQTQREHATVPRTLDRMGSRFFFLPRKYSIGSDRLQLRHRNRVSALPGVPAPADCSKSLDETLRDDGAAAATSASAAIAPNDGEADIGSGLTTDFGAAVRSSEASHERGMDGGGGIMKMPGGPGNRGSIAPLMGCGPNGMTPAFFIIIIIMNVAGIRGIGMPIGAMPPGPIMGNSGGAAPKP